jgi:hypothetical protein
MPIFIIRGCIKFGGRKPDKFLNQGGVYAISN